jgi:hypothetical protein
VAGVMMACFLFLALAVFCYWQHGAKDRLRLHNHYGLDGIEVRERFDAGLIAGEKFNGPDNDDDNPRRNGHGGEEDFKQVPIGES